MDETDNDISAADAGTPVGEQLRAAREDKGLSLEELARDSRIPQRHLENLEAGIWSKLPAATYSVGFAKTYAEAVGLDREAIGNQVRAEMGAWQPPTAHVGAYEVADTSRGMPRWVIVVAAAAVIGAILLFSWMNDRRLAAEEEAAEAVAEAEPAEVTPAVADPAPPEGPVRLIATDEVWLRVRDGDDRLYEGLMTRGEDYLVPASASAPTLETARPEALRVTVGDTDIVQLGPDSERVRDVSLLASDLLERGTRAAPTGSAPARQTSAAAPRPTASTTTTRTAATQRPQRSAPRPTTQRAPAAEAEAEPTSAPAPAAAAPTPAPAPADDAAGVDEGDGDGGAA
ncbi:helix-turn-helix domain-containing protein [Sphingomicrobium astaxanthinifaciens]|uniref:helix-turn-helix domain-containing protein n=1 Tax=Sphingomicrobium astaxanthinifaciens TaxID=1227949 RepID=UPI001FCC6EF3|nr:RodZ domain-containing protein [Sphingomicrobium astaxanthinifaciens]MCJ7421534.1 helix-turn-helix domain-containing protein [Sphingomicrobium astaxanthinifaciens]